MVVVFFCVGWFFVVVFLIFDLRLCVLVGAGVDCGSCGGGSFFVFILVPRCSGLVVVVGVVDVGLFLVWANCLICVVWWVNSLACAFC